MHSLYLTAHREPETGKSRYNRKMDSTLLLAKLGISIIVVLGLSLIAERVSPRVAGVLSGYPAGIALNLFFFGYEIGPAFAAQSALYTLIGLVATQAFVYFYYVASSGRRPCGIAATSALAFAGYLAVIWIIRQAPIGVIMATVVAVSSAILFLRLFRRIPDLVIADRVRITHGVMVVRAGTAAGIIILITGLAHVVGPEYAGLFAAFPSTLFPIMLILHASYGAPTVHALVKHFPSGLGSLIVYDLAVYALYEPLGIWLGTLSAFGIATLYLLGYAVYDSLAARKKNRVKTCGEEL